MEETMDQSAIDGGAAVCNIETIQKVLQICWCEEKCLIDKGAYGRVYRGKWKENPESDSTIDVAVKHPSGPYHIEYEIATLRIANGHRNILNFLGQIKYGPNR